MHLQEENASLALQLRLARQASSAVGAGVASPTGGSSVVSPTGKAASRRMQVLPAELVPSPAKANADDSDLLRRECAALNSECDALRRQVCTFKLSLGVSRLWCSRAGVQGASAPLCRVAGIPVPARCMDESWL